MKLYLRRFTDLSRDELYRIIQLRIQVFVVEQACPYLELDDNDQKAFHLFLEEEGKIIGYLRCSPIEMDFSTLRLSRFCLTPDYRNRKLGMDMFNFILEYIERQWNSKEIHISAQEYLEGFYNKFGFSPTSAVYEEDGILHIDMKKTSDEATQLKG